MKTIILILWLIVCLGVGYWLFSKKTFRVLAVIVFVILFVSGGSIIDVSVMSNKLKNQLDEVTSVCGDTYIKTKGDTIYVLVNNKWLDLSKIDIIGPIMTDKITIRYDGEEVYIGESGVVNTVRVLESFGFIKKE